MKKHKKKKALQDIRQRRLFCAFSDINDNFAEWYNWKLIGWSKK